MPEEAPEGIDRSGIESWFQANVPGTAPPLSFERISGGRSNLTFAVSDAQGRRWALRRPPLGKGLTSAHDVGREHRVMSALAPTDVPVPPTIGMCDDESVNGAPFFVMDFVDGPVLRTQREAAESFDEPERYAIGRRVADTLVAIHSIDPDEVGIGDLGKKQDYVARQLHRWHGQWEKSKTRDVPLIDDVHERLSARIPEQGPATIVHGDYRLDNMILSAEGEVAAVVDWELCTLGDPLADVGMLLVYWSEPGDELIPLLDMPTTAPGFPRREEVKARYAELSGRDLSEIDFYVALAYWKLGIILQGIIARVAAGQYGKGEDGGRETAELVESLADAADEAERRLG
ncbi:MAG TPA: phosphotransferase family protein [Solirubrobacterales bacterium]|jgi:aminoglycoside phosphotransferase (APT) family kinase protein|nr:phosphotransferase family protein [Solirubrobacterales bacterium]